MTEKKQNKFYQILFDFIVSFLGCFLFSYAFFGFLMPNEVAIGGIGGISSAIMSSFGVKMGTLMILINTPLLILALIFIGRRFAINTTLVILGSSLMMNYITPMLPKYEGQQLLGTIFGSLLLGVGIALIFTRGFTTGGTDIIGRLLQIKFPAMSIGNLMMLVDFFIICASSYIYTLGDGPNNGIDSALYGLIATFIYTKTIDSVLSGANKMKIVYIISDKYPEISSKLMSEINRGLTKFHTEKVYSKQETKMIMCVVRSNEITKVKKIIRNIDDRAFLIILSSDDVIGGDFHQIGI